MAAKRRLRRRTTKEHGMTADSARLWRGGQRKSRPRPLAFEPLETRTMLAADLASIMGVAFNDVDSDGLFEPLSGEVGIAGARVQLTGANDQGPITPSTTVTGADGSYRFDNLRPGTYEVTQLVPAPTGYFSSPAAVPLTVVITAADAAGVPGAAIDSFDGVEQTLNAYTPASSPVSSSVADVRSIGGTRDMLAEVTSPEGIVSLNSNAAFLPGVLEINPGSSSVGAYLVTWDSDLDPSDFDPIGLRSIGAGQDLTD